MRFWPRLALTLGLLVASGLLVFLARAPMPTPLPGERPPPEPALEEDHILVDKASNRLLLFRRGRAVREYVVATGEEPGDTPEGAFRVAEMVVDPGGPFGTRWIGLECPEQGRLNQGIHGTNDPESIGLRTTQGCIRMRNNDVEELFAEVTTGMPVVIQ